MRPLRFHRLTLLTLTTFSLSCLIIAVPQTYAPTPLAVEPRRPPQGHAPGCPTANFAHHLSQIFLQSIYDPPSSIEKQFGGYDAFTRDYFWDNFTIKDITPNYPAEKNGGKLAPLGRWAKSRFTYRNKLKEVVPAIRKIFGDIHWDENELYFGGTEDNDCLTAFWKGTYIATLLKPYG